MASRSTLPGKAPKPTFRCTECGAGAVRWVGRCAECQAWGSLEEVGAARARAVAPGVVSAPAQPISQVDAGIAQVRPTGLAELDRVLGGGLVPGGVVLLAGEPGVGKSTLLLEVAHRTARAHAPALIVSGEESVAQIRIRAGRMGTLSEHLFIAAETDLAALLGHVEAVGPGLLVVDSVQTVAHPEVDGAAGGVTQIREVTAALIRVAKERHLPVILVGHVTKDGSIAGPRVLEHLVDVVLSFEGERHGRLRLIRAVKNRFGATDEVGCFAMTEDGIEGLADPSGLFLSAASRTLVPGTCVTVALEGRRPLVAEVQALVSKASASFPRRAVTGLESARVAMLAAVLEKRGGRRVLDCDIYASTVGGVTLSEPATDLAVLLAMAGSEAGTAVPPGTAAFGEVGLAGEIRPVSGLPRRIAEAARLGFTRALVPAGAQLRESSVDLISVTDVAQALRVLGAPGSAH
ncbi:MAG TPA: DNA repair protein RadA [Mycobacteriales bacterium]|nr:DNA repair protein RadA [Mycobacteriales bacterium]